MEYKIGQDGLIFIQREDGHADLARGNIVLVCLTDSEHRALLQFFLDAETKKQVLLDISASASPR